MLQNCVGLINDESDSGSEVLVTTLDNGTEEGNIAVQEESPEAIIPPIQPKPEVSVWVLCIGSNVSCFQEHLLPQKQILQMHFNCPYILLCILQFIIQSNHFTKYILTNFCIRILQVFDFCI